MKLREPSRWMQAEIPLPETTFSGVWATDHGRWYAVGHKGGVWWDGPGNEWREFRRLRRSSCNAVIEIGDKLYVSCDGKSNLRASSDHGNTWKALKTPVAGSPYRLEHRNGSLKIVGRNGAAITHDQGETWELVDDCDVFETRSGSISMGCHGVDRFVDGQWVWAGSAGGYARMPARPRDMLVRGETVLLSAHSNLLHRSSDGGKTWDTPVDLGFFPHVMRGHAQHVVAAGNYGNLWCSDDFGLTWNSKECYTGYFTALWVGEGGRAIAAGWSGDPVEVDGELLLGDRKGLVVTRERAPTNGPT